MSNGPRRGIPEPQIQVSRQPLRFSFKHLDFSNTKFCLEQCQGEFLATLMQRLQIFSTWTVELFTDQNNKEHRHIINFDETSEKDGFANIPYIDKEQLGFHEAWQFGVKPEVWENSWRVHGILIDDTFYVIWLDPEHKLFATNGQGD